MPRVKLAAVKRDRLAELINGRMALNKKYATDACTVMGCSYRTAVKRLKNPAEMRISELVSLAKWLAIPIDEVRQLIG